MCGGGGRISADATVSELPFFHERPDGKHTFRILNNICIDYLGQRCQWEVIKNAELDVVVSLCVRSKRAMPQKGQDRSPKGEYVLYRVRNYLRS